MDLFAYVKFYIDNVRDFVPVSDIKNFNPKSIDDYEASRLYLVKWRTGLDAGTDEDVYYKAQILMLDVSKAKLQERLESSRVPVPVIYDTSVESSGEADSPRGEVVLSSKRITKDKKEKKKKEAAASKKTLQDIMDRNLQKKKSSPVCSTQAPLASSCSSCVTMKKTLSSTKELLLKAQKERDEAKAEAKECGRLNKRLQESILDRFESNKVCRIEDEEAGFSGSPSRHAERQQPSRSGPLEKHTERHQFSVQDGKVHVGGDIWLEEKKWDIIQLQRKHSMFVKTFVTGVWGVDGLKGRSVDGLGSKPGLSPKKVKVIKDRLKDRLNDQGFSSSEQEYEMAKFKKYITEKIQDVNRKDKAPAN